MTTAQVHFIDPHSSRAMIELDRAFEDRFASLGAQRWKLPPLLPAAPLKAIGYFENFHHIANVVGKLPDADCDCEVIDNGGLVVPSAACYGVYLQLRDTALDANTLITVNANCARYEQSYEPLVRLGAYSLRELIQIGDLAETRAFFAAMQNAVVEFAKKVGLPITLEVAADSFFQTDSPKSVLQKLSKTKLELVYAGQLAVGSINFHRNYFGDRFGISHGGEPAFTSCFGVGLERWAHMIRDASDDAANYDHLLRGICDAIAEWELIDV
jgi:hypothetical protein